MYYPKSHITPNLYSNGEFSIVGSNNTPYTGYYFSTIDGKYFTGRYPEDGNNLPLTNILGESAEDVIDEVFADLRFGTTDNNLYSLANNITPNTPISSPIIPFYPSPSTQDYKLGEFTRYFAKKINQDQYIETSFLVPNELYIAFKLPWLIRGDKNEVARVNENIVRLREQELGISRFGDYLKHNYLKYYK
jgi:hypothetical protein